MTMMDRLVRRFQLLAIYKKFNLIIKAFRDEKLKGQERIQYGNIKESWSPYVVSDEVDFQTQNSGRVKEDII